MRLHLYSIYGETIAIVSILRAFGASFKFPRDILRCVNTVRGLLSRRRSETDFSSLGRTTIRITGYGEANG